MKKKFLALVLTLAMVLSLVPATALATDGTSGTTTNDVVYGHYEGNAWKDGAPTRSDELKDTVTTVDKTAKKVADNQYEVTLTVQMKHKTEEVQPGAAATVLVIDKSGSMNYCTDPNHKHETNCGTWRGKTSRLSVAKTAAINFLKSYSGFSDSDFSTDGKLSDKATDKNLKRYVSLVTFNDSASVKQNWIDVSTKDGYQNLVNAINEIRASDGTNLDAALRLAKTQSDKITQIEKGKRNVIALTDGVPTFYGNNVEKHGNYGCPETNDATARSADALKAKVNAVYTVCFGAANDKCWTEGSTHTWLGLIPYTKHETDGPTVGSFLRDSIATKPVNGSNEQYAYNAANADKLYEAFAAITQTITDGLNEGVVTDGLPAGVTDVKGSGFATTWTLDSSSVTPTTSNGYNVYTYTKTYRVNVDPAAVSTVKVGEVNYAPLNTLTTLTVQHNGSPVVIHFPIPAGKVTYSLTNFKKELVTEEDNFSNPPAGVTIPENATSTVTVGENGVTLLYKITVSGDKGAKFTVIDTGATLVPPTDDSIVFNQTDSTFSGTVGTTGETVFYVSKHFDIDANTQTVSNTATIAPGDNAKGPADDKKTKTVTTTVTEPDPQTYTVIFNANGGAWSDSSEIKTTPNLNANAKITLPDSDPGSNGKKFQGWGYYPNGMDAAPEQIPALSFEALTVERLYAVVNPTETPENTVTLYAIWKDVPQSAYTYTIRQHFMKDEKQELGAQNYIKLKEVQAGTEISTLIPSDTQVEFDGRMYLYEANNTTVNNQKYQGTEKITGTNTVIDLYYYLDSWKDGDIGSGDNTDDSLTGGDGTPDYKQILIQYQVYQEGNGQVSPTFEVVTVKDNKELTAIHGSSVTKAGTGYTFVTWTGQNVAVTEKTVGDIIKETSAEKLKKEKCDLSKDTFEQGKSYTYTAIFLEDKLGGGDNKDQPDGIPDRYQVTINYVSSDTSKGSVGTLTKEVLTIYENGKEGKWASKGKVVASGSTATATGNRCYFVNWTKQQEGSTASSTVTSSANLPAQTIENAKGGDVYTFTANFDRSSGGGSGGSNRPKPPVVEIPDDVPTGLNGKDHYAYVVGYPDGMVYPQKNITRAEVATIFFRLLEDETREANMTKSNGYNDMKDGAWYTCAVSTLSKMGIIKGYEDGSFKPDASISRAEFAAIAARFDPDGDKTPATFSDVSSHWAKDEISIAANHGWIKGYEDGSFKPDQKITRAETMTLVNRVLKRLPETKDDLHKDMKTWPDNQNESAWFYLAVQEATNSHYQKLKKDGTHEKWESMRETRDWAALEK